MNELPLRKIFAILDGETKGPDLHNGPIGLNLSKCEEADVAGFIPIEIDQILKRYLENCQDLGSDQQYLRDIILSITYGANNSLKRRSPGKLGNACWLTTANRILRYYTSQNNPTLNLVYLVRFVIKVYARNWFAIKYQPRFTNPPKHIFNFIENIHELDCELIRDECFRTISRNSFLLHTELILIGMLSDTNPSVMIEAVNRILQARVNGEKDGIRYFHLPKIDFNATHYYNLVLYVDDWLEPILTRSYSTEDLRTYTVENIDIFDFPNIQCHSQHVERTIRLVSETATKLADPKERDQRIRMTIHFRKCLECTDGHLANERCYRLRSAAKWEAAIDDCSSIQAHLIYTDGATEQQVMRDILKADKVSSSIWLGANLKTDTGTGNGDLWKWADDSIISGQGCYNDKRSNRDLPNLRTIPSVTPRLCVEECKKEGYTYAGVQNGDECYCGNSFGKHGMVVGCVSRCISDRKQRCGGNSKNFIYHTQGSYGQWAYAQPNNFVGNQYCVRISRHVDYKFGDEACAKEFSYICDVDSNNCDTLSDTAKVGYVRILSRCLFVNKEPTNWFTARRDCKDKGGDLFKMDTLDIYNAIMARYTSEPNNRMYWIGLHSRTWSWTSGIPIIYTNWQTNFPLNDTGNCVSASSFDDYRWRNERCDNTLPYYCVTEPRTTTTLPPSTTRPVARTTSSGKVFTTSTVTTASATTLPTARDPGVPSTAGTVRSTGKVGGVLRRARRGAANATTVPVLKIRPRVTATTAPSPLLTTTRFTKLIVPVFTTMRSTVPHLARESTVHSSSTSTTQSFTSKHLDAQSKSQSTMQLSTQSTSQSTTQSSSQYNNKLEITSTYPRTISVFLLPTFSTMPTNSRNIPEIIALPSDMATSTTIPVTQTTRPIPLALSLPSSSRSNSVGKYSAISDIDSTTTQSSASKMNISRQTYRIEDSRSTKSSSVTLPSREADDYSASRSTTIPVVRLDDKKLLTTMPASTFKVPSTKITAKTRTSTISSKEPTNSATFNSIRNTNVIVSSRSTVLEENPIDLKRKTTLPILDRTSYPRNTPTKLSISETNNGKRSTTLPVGTVIPIEHSGTTTRIISTTFPVQKTTYPRGNGVASIDVGVASNDVGVTLQSAHLPHPSSPSRTTHSPRSTVPVVVADSVYQYAAASMSASNATDTTTMKYAEKSTNSIDVPSPSTAGVLFDVTTGVTTSTSTTTPSTTTIAKTTTTVKAVTLSKATTPTTASITQATPTTTLNNNVVTPKTGASTTNSSSLSTVELILIIFCVILLILIIIAIITLYYFKKNSNNSVGPDNNDYRYKSTIPSSTPYIIDDGYATNSDYGSMAGLVHTRQKSDKYVNQKIQIDDNRFDKY